MNDINLPQLYHFCFFFQVVNQECKYMFTNCQKNRTEYQQPNNKTRKATCWCWRRFSERKQLTTNEHCSIIVNNYCWTNNSKRTAIYKFNFIRMNRLESIDILIVKIKLGFCKVEKDFFTQIQIFSKVISVNW